MARSVIDLSSLDSTSKLLSDLHLTPSPENMGSVNSENFMDVPDTPDRLAVESSDPVSASGRNFFHLQRGNCRPRISNGNIRNLHAQHQRDLRIVDSVADNSQKESLTSNEYVSDGFKKPELPFRGLHRNLTKRSLGTKRLEDRIDMGAGTEVSIETQPKKHLALIKRDLSSSNQLNMGGKVDLDLPQMFTPQSGKNKLPILVSDVNSQGGNGEKVINLISPDSPCYVGDRYARRKMHIGNGSLDMGNNPCMEITPDAHDEILNSNLASRLGFTRKPETQSNMQVANDKFVGSDATINHVDVNAEAKSRDNGKAVMVCDDSQSQMKETVSSCSQSVILARPTLRRRRLVRNGFICPDNIARSNTLDDHQKEVRNDKQDGADSACNQNDKRKGKGIVEDNALANEFASRRNELLPSEGVSGARHTNDDINRFVEEVGGWRGTRNHTKRTFLSASEVNTSSIGNDDLSYLVDQCCDNAMENSEYGSENLNSNSEIDLHEIGSSYPTRIVTHPSPVQTISSIIPDLDPEKERRFHRGQKLKKRQRRFNSSARYHPGDCSSSGFDDSEVSYLHSSRKASTVNLTRRVRSSQHQGMSEPFIDVDNLCSPVRRSVRPTEGTSSTHIPLDNSSARARQVEEDEILARQLQEQLYDELPVVGDAEIDASIAWTLQQEENARRSTSVSAGNRGVSNPRDSSIARMYRNYPLEFSRNSVRSISRVGGTSGRGRVPTSMRMAQLRRNFHGRSPNIPSAGRRFPFPSSMDLDMRIHLLEALEAGFGENNDMAMHHPFFQVERDFNENDYEMLLALDNDNDRHGGASLGQINRLPLSVVQQTDHFEETCAICLETPSAGDAIRHLPCLHKFHKECIDPWLGRQPLCPICKSSIT